MAADGHLGYTEMAITSQPISLSKWCLVLWSGFWLSLDFYHRGRHTRTAVARNPCVSWVFLLLPRYAMQALYRVVWLGVGFVIERLRVRFPAVPPLGATLGKLFTHMCLRSPSSINWYRLPLGVKCTTGAVWGMLAAIRRTLRLAANRRHSSIVLTCGCRCIQRPWSDFCHLRRYINWRSFIFLPF